MRMRTIEISVGLFIAAGIGALFLLALEVSGLSLRPQESTYKVYAEFTDIGGLRVRAKVSVAGVTIGRVSKIGLDNRSVKALVEMQIRSDIDFITRDSIARVTTAGLLGEKYVDISIGGDFDVLGEGDYFESSQGALNLEKLISDFATSNL